MIRLFYSLVFLTLSTATAWAGVKVVKDAPDTSQAYQSRRVALIVGVDEYADPSLQSLSFSGKDATDFARVLTEADAGGFDKVQVLVGPEKTTRSAILSALDALTVDLQRDDTLLLYLSGHGTLTLDPIDGTQLYFLPSNASLDQPGKEGILVSWLEEALSKTIPRRRVLILDTCHNGRSKSGISSDTQERLSSLRGEPPVPNQTHQITESEARLYAAQFYQPAMEDKSLKNGVYTHFLLDALTENAATADLNGDGLVDVAEAHDFAQDRTVKHTGGMQIPRAEYRVVGRESIYLTGDPKSMRDAENALISSYKGLLTSARLLIDGQSRGVLPRVIPVEPGRHKVEVQTADGRTIARRSAVFRAGEHIQIESLLEPQSNRWAVLAGSHFSIHGDGAGFLAPMGTEFEVGFSPKPAAKRVQPTVYSRASYARGPLMDGTESAQAGQSGWWTAGGFMGFAPNPFLHLGPQVESGVLWRTGEWFGEVRQQASPMVGVGGRAQVFVPVGRQLEVTLRYDFRASFFRQNQTWSTLGTHGVAAGLSFR